MAKRKLTKEERLNQIRLHKIIMQIIIALGFCSFVILVILNNVYPDIDNWFIQHGYTWILLIIFLGAEQLFMNRRWRKNPDLYDGKQDERDKKITGQIMTGVVGIYFLLSSIAIIVTFILALLDIISIFVPTIIICNLLVLSIIMFIIDAIVKKKNS